MVVSALAIATAIALWDKTFLEKRAVFFLMPLVSIYVFSTHSMAAVFGLMVALAGFGFYHLRRTAARSQTALLLIVSLSSLAIYGAARESGWLASQLVPDGQVVVQETWQIKLSIPSDPSASAMPKGVVQRFEQWRFFYNGVLESPRSFLTGHATPPDRETHPSAHNYWLDTAYNFGTIALIPLIGMLVWTLRTLWVRRDELLEDSILFGLALAVLYLLIFENMLKVGMRQPYPGIITFFLWGLLIARLRLHGSRIDLTEPRTV